MPGRNPEDDSDIATTAVSLHGSDLPREEDGVPEGQQEHDGKYFQPLRKGRLILNMTLLSQRRTHKRCRR